MKFTHIVLENVFAYEGRAEFDLSGMDDNRNVVLIWGRNGMGKTSFLNAMKILFTGINQSEFRKVGFPPAALGMRQYIFGDGSQWTGLVNRAARRKAALAGDPVEARVEARWNDADGEQVVASRSWTIEGENYTSSVYVSRGEIRLAGAAAEDQLENILPADLVKFFFFDGEDIKSIAETSGSLQRDFDRLLQITFVEELALELEKIASERRRRGMETNLRRLVDAARSERDRAVTTQKEAQEKLADIQEQIDTDAIELRRLQLRRENLSSGASAAQRAALEARRSKLTQELSDVTEEIGRVLPVSVPVLANLRLITDALAEAETRLKAGGSAEAGYVERISARMVDWVRSAAPDLSLEVAQQIAEFVTERMRIDLTGTQTVGPLASVDTSRMQRLHSALQTWSIAGPERRSLHVRLLGQARRIKDELRDTDDELMHIEVGSQANLDEFRKVASRIAELEDAGSSHNQQKGIWSAKLSEAVKAESAASAELSRLEASQDQASQEAAEGRFVANIARTLNEISDALRKATRAELELALNDRFKRIINHPLIGHISVDDTYTLTYREKNGRPIGRTSLSSGMKQLAATAFLWAMKDSAGSEIPVIIDTPLGRIDRENQEHLLYNYYPKLAHQVIILPTNAEIDGRKRNMLEPHVARHFRIANESGEGAKVEVGALVELA